MVTASARRTSPQDLLALFRATHRDQMAVVDGVTWRYYSCGRGAKTLLMLPGAPGLGDCPFQNILALEQDYHIISLSYPAEVTTIEGLVRGVAGILAAQGIRTVTVIGGSFGGMIAQLFARTYPESVSQLILDHAGMPRPGRARVFRWLVTLTKLLPLMVIRWILRAGTATALLAMPPAGRAFWIGYYEEVILRLKKQDYLNRLVVYHDFDTTYTLTPDEPHWRGDTLIIEADNDSFVTARERAALRRLYPNAQVHTFHGTAHFAWATDTDEYRGVIERFLRDGRP